MKYVSFELTYTFNDKSLAKDGIVTLSWIMDIN